MRFIEKLVSQAIYTDSLVCTGIDPDTKLMPPHLKEHPHHLYEFNKTIIEATVDDVCAYKFNSAFFEAHGPKGITALQQSCAVVPPRVPIILDMKRGDIAHSAEKYAEYAYDIIGADAVTINPYMGFDAVKPFLRPEKCVFVLCLTSNASADDFQLLETGDGPLYLSVARAAKRWTDDGEVGLVVGATRPDMIGRVRDAAGDIPFLVPGIGAQGGDIAGVLEHSGSSPAQTIINSSRQILYASSGTDYGQAAANALAKLNREINQYRK